MPLSLTTRLAKNGVTTPDSACLHSISTSRSPSCAAHHPPTTIIIHLAGSGTESKLFAAALTTLDDPQYSILKMCQIERQFYPCGHPMPNGDFIKTKCQDHNSALGCQNQKIEPKYHTFRPCPSCDYSEHNRYATIENNKLDARDAMNRDGGGGGCGCCVM